MDRGVAATPQRPDTLVLCYHAISSDWPELIALEPSRFEGQVARLLAAGWRPATFTEAVLAPPAAKTLAVTFDDGFRSVVRLAAPILRRLGVPATMFVVGAFPCSGGPLAWPHLDRWVGTRYEPELEPASWAELADLRDAGWEIGSHTDSHPRLPSLAPDEVALELRKSKAEIERRLGASCRAIAYPYGEVTPEISEEAREIGFEAGAALLPIRHGHDRLRFPRVLVSSQESDTLHRWHLRPTVRRLQGTAVWPVVRTLTRSTERCV